MELTMLDYYKFKEIYDLFVQGQYEKAHQLLTELQTKYIELYDENIKLRLQLHDLEDTIFFAKTITFDGYSYWFSNNKGKQGPFCKYCYEQQNILSHIDTTTHYCESCGSHDNHTDSKTSTLSSAKHAPGPCKIILFQR